MIYPQKLTFVPKKRPPKSIREPQQAQYAEVFHRKLALWQIVKPVLPKMRYSLCSSEEKRYI